MTTKYQYLSIHAQSIHSEAPAVGPSYRKQLEPAADSLTKKGHKMIMLDHNMVSVYLKYSNLKRINAYSFTQMFWDQNAS